MVILVFSSKQVIGKMGRTPGGAQGAENLGIHVEGPFISPQKKGAHDVQYIWKFTNVSWLIPHSEVAYLIPLYLRGYQGFKTIEEVYGPHWKNITMITLAPELERSSEVIGNLTKHGVTVSVGKLPAR